MQRDVTVEQVVEQFGSVLQSVSDLVAVLTSLKICVEEHVCLKILLLANDESEFRVKPRKCLIFY